MNIEPVVTLNTARCAPPKNFIKNNLDPAFKSRAKSQISPNKCSMPPNSRMNTLLGARKETSISPVFRKKSELEVGVKGENLRHLLQGV